MKNNDLNYFIIGLLTFIVLSIKINAQNKTFYDNLISMFNVQKETVLEKQTSSSEEKIKTIAGKNMEEFLRKANLLKSQGNSQEEIIKILSQKRVYGTGSISGTIYYSDGTTPVLDFLSVYVFDKYGIMIANGYITSWSKGQYSISELSAGKYYVRTNSDKYFDEFYDDAATWEQATLVEVLDGQETKGINFSLNYYQGVISGNVIDTDNNLLNDCSITANELTNYAVFFTNTDSIGNYNLSHLRPGTYVIYCNYNGEKNYIKQYYLNADTEEDATTVVLQSEDTVKNINFTLSQGGAISGKITKNNGQLFLPYEIRLLLYKINGEYPYAYENIDSLGYFYFKRLNTGNYKLLAEYNGGDENYVETWFRDSYNMSGAEVIQVQSGDTVKNINFTMKQGGAISGKVSATNSTFNGGSIIVYDKDMNYIARYNFYNSENYLISGLVPGDYKLLADFQDYQNQWYNNKDDFENADWVTVNPNDTTENISFNLEPNPPTEWAAITGHIYDPQGQPCQGSVRLYDLDGDREAYVTGYFSYSLQVIPGDYKIEVYSSDYGYEWYNNKDNFQAADTIRLSANQTKKINFNFDELSSLAGFVTDDSGNRVDGDKYSVYAAVFDASTGAYINDRSITFLGGYKLKLRPGSYKLGLIPIYFNYQSNYDDLTRTFYRSGVSFNDDSALPINLFPLTDLEIEDIELPKASGSITGIIYNSDNKPIDSLAYGLLLYDEDGLLAKASIYSIDESNNGNFKLNGLRPGKYYLLALIVHSTDYIQMQWYDGINSNESFYSLNLKVNLPDNINAIEVGTGEVPDINFHFNTATYLNPEKELITGFMLNQNYPNPFNPTTKISWQSPVSSQQTINVFDVLGKEVDILVNEYKPAGSYEVEFNASKLSSGVYFYQLKVGGFIQTKKMVLMK